MYHIIILPVAQQDIKEAAHWYNARQNGLGKKFTRQVRQSIHQIKQDPFIFAIR